MATTLVSSKNGGKIKFFANLQQFVSLVPKQLKSVVQRIGGITLW